MTESLYFVWKKYQRRAEILAPKMSCSVIFMPHLFRRKFLRPIDYFHKLVLSSFICFIKKPKFVVVQSPPLFGAIPALLLRVPYIIDAHNPVFQSFDNNDSWDNLPLSKLIIGNALGVIVHNHSIMNLAVKKYPKLDLFTIPDPICEIGCAEKLRSDKDILVICSFDPDEPIEILLESIKQLPNYTFTVTADPLKLPLNLRTELRALPNVRLTGFLPIQEYHSLLCRSQAALVLTNHDSIQPSGACEALSSDTQLIVSTTPLIRELFGEWAILVDNNSQSIVMAIQQLEPQNLNLSDYREAWNKSVSKEIDKLLSKLSRE